MQKPILFLLSILLFVACNNNASNENLADDSLANEAELLPEERLPWITVYDSVKNNFVLEQRRQVKAETLTPEGVIHDINAMWEKVKLEFRNISNDTLYVAIPHSDYLTHQMGSAGSLEYFATTTFNLTELKGIRFVNYDFKQGDHAQPGTYSRDNFKEFR